MIFDAFNQDAARNALLETGAPDARLLSDVGEHVPSRMPG